jgi:hypothetical protein
MKLDLEVEKRERRWKRCFADGEVVGPGVQAATFPNTAPSNLCSNDTTYDALHAFRQASNFIFHVLMKIFEIAKKVPR